MLAGGVVDDQVDDHRDATLVGGRDECPEVVGGPVVLLDRPIVDDVVAVVAGRLGNRHQPQTGDAEIVRRRLVAVVQVVEVRGEAAQIADTVAVRVGETADEDLIEHAIAPPPGGRAAGRRRAGRRSGAGLG